MGEDGSTCPRKIGLNWFIPALAKRRVGSFRGAHAEDGTLVCSFCSKYSTKVDLTLSVDHLISSVLSDVVENRAEGLKICLAIGE